MTKWAARDGPEQSAEGVCVDTQDIEVLLVLSEELHFGRTAQRLHLSPARVTQVVQRAEREIGGALFERTSRRVTQTRLGVQLLSDLDRVRTDLRASIERAKRLASGEVATLRLGKIGWDVIELKPAIDRFAAARPGLEIKIRQIRFSDPFGALRAGAIDAVLAWLPVLEPDLSVGPLAYTEPILMAMATDHPLATRESVTLEDFGDFTVMAGARPDYWQDAIVPRTTPSGRPVTIGINVASFEEMLPVLSSGEAISPVHAHAVRYASRPDITYRPITDAPPARWALVWRTSAETPTICDLAEALTPGTNSPGRPGGHR